MHTTHLVNVVCVRLYTRLFQQCVYLLCCLGAGRTRHVVQIHTTKLLCRFVQNDVKQLFFLATCRVHVVVWRHANKVRIVHTTCYIILI